MYMYLTPFSFQALAKLYFLYSTKISPLVYFQASKCFKIVLNLWNNLKKECNTTKELRSIFKNTPRQFKNDEQFKLMTSKGICPHEYAHSFHKLYDTQLPSQIAFISV